MEIPSEALDIGYYAFNDLKDRAFENSPVGKHNGKAFGNRFRHGEFAAHWIGAEGTYVHLTQTGLQIQIGSFVIFPLCELEIYYPQQSSNNTAAPIRDLHTYTFIRAGDLVTATIRYEQMPRPLAEYRQTQLPPLVFDNEIPTDNQRFIILNELTRGASGSYVPEPA